MLDNQQVTKKEKYNIDKLQKRLRRNVGEAIADFNMIEEGDRIMVCLSGGKDSYTMLEILRNLQKSAPISFSLVAVNLDQKQPGFPEHILPEYLEQLGVEYKIVEENTYGIVKEKIPEGKTTCSLCSRLRRGILYRTASELGATKIALGHHRDDIIETFLLNLFHGGRLASMPPKLVNEEGDLFLYRPLAFAMRMGGLCFDLRPDGVSLAGILVVLVCGLISIWIDKFARKPVTQISFLKIWPFLKAQSKPTTMPKIVPNNKKIDFFGKNGEVGGNISPSIRYISKSFFSGSCCFKRFIFTSVARSPSIKGASS